MMPKSVERFSDDIMLYLFNLEPDSDFGSSRPEIIQLCRRQVATALLFTGFSSSAAAACGRNLNRISSGAAMKIDE